MKAIVHRVYGSPDVLEFQEVEKPSVGDNQVLIRVHAAAVNPLDWHSIRGVPYVMRTQAGLRKPKNGALGVDLAGTIEAVGKNVTQFRPGDHVYGNRTGAFAEYVNASPKFLAPKPANVSFEEAAAVPVAAVTALQALRDHGHLLAGQSVLINGASGGVGTFAVQIARSLGAKVTGVCSTGNVELVRSLGAERVIDHTRANFTKLGDRYDLILDLIGNHSLNACRRATARKGTFVLCSGGGVRRSVLGPIWRVIRAKALSPFVSQAMVFFIAQTNTEDLTYLAKLIEAGEVKPVIDRMYPLNATADAIRYVEEGHARGKVVITVSS